MKNNLHEVGIEPALDWRDSLRVVDDLVDRMIAEGRIDPRDLRLVSEILARLSRDTADYLL